MKKNLKVRGITAENDFLVYVSHPPFIDYTFFKYKVEYSGKQVPAELVLDHVRDDEIVVSSGIAEKLGLRLGDKIKLKIRLFGSQTASYMELYEKKPKKFIKYFNEQSPTDKKIILKDILESDFFNDEVVAWLDKNESELVREVGLGLVLNFSE